MRSPGGGTDWNLRGAWTVKIFVIGSSLLSSYWNGAATYYRGIYKHLAALGHEITFAEPEIYDRQKNRDAGDFKFARSLVYRTPHELDDVLALASESDLVIKHSGVGADDEFFEREVLQLRRRPKTWFRPHSVGITGEAESFPLLAFWDVDAPATLARLEENPCDPFAQLIPQYDFIFTYGGGPPVVGHYLKLGARNCFAIYNAVDPATHHPVAPDPELLCDLAFVGHRLPDRERRIEQFFLKAAELAPEKRFILGGEGWAGKALPLNVRWIGHVGTNDHNRVNCSARMVLNVNRDSMAQIGFSPPTRVFEAAGAGACVITDSWDGVQAFFEPDSEILVARNAAEVAGYLRNITREQARAIGERMRRRALADHAYELRARQVSEILTDAAARPPWTSAQTSVSSV